MTNLLLVKNKLNLILKCGSVERFTFCCGTWSDEVPLMFQQRRFSWSNNRASMNEVESIGEVGGNQCNCEGLWSFTLWRKLEDAKSLYYFCVAMNSSWEKKQIN